MESKFIKGVERLVDPIVVGTVHYIQNFNRLLPGNVQKKMMKSMSEKNPQMGFVVEPYSFFIFYQVEDSEEVRSMLPKGFTLLKTRVFQEEEEHFYGVFGCFNAHTSSFWGTRIEFYLIAKEEATGLLSWIIIDYDTNTITYDPKNGLSDPNASGSVFTIDYNGVICCDVRNNEGRVLDFLSNTKSGVTKNLDERLWLEGNLSIAYGPQKAGKELEKFSLLYEPAEFKEALKIPLESLTMNRNDWYPGILGKEPKEVVCFPYAQHFLSDSPGYSSGVRSVEELIEKIKGIDFSKISVFQVDSFKKSMLAGVVISAIINLILLVSLILK